jgi:DNA gyrase subunit B
MNTPIFFVTINHGRIRSPIIKFRDLIYLKAMNKKDFYSDVKEKKSSSYNAGQITVLEGLEPVRRRPGVFIGSTGIKGLHHLVGEIIDNSIDESLAGFCDKVLLSINANLSVSICDYGRGIPTDIHPITGKTALETVLTILHAGGKFGDGGYKVSGGLHGVGISVVNGLSEFLNVNTRRLEKKYSMRFVRGKSIGEYKSIQKKTKKSGTSVNFKPDYQIFSTNFSFDPFVLGGRLNELAFLNPKLSLNLDDRRFCSIKTSKFSHHGGLPEYVEILCQATQKLHQIVEVEKESKGVSVSVALLWSNVNYQENLISFTNNIRTTEGGTHVDGLKNVLTRTINSMGKKLGKVKENTPNISGDFIREGLTGIINVKVSEPEFEGQVKSKLSNQDVKTIVDQVVGQRIKHFFENENQIALEMILEKALAAQTAFDAAKKAREISRKKFGFEHSTLPGKLADCSTRNPSLAEIFIVEGDSAGGSAKQARNRRYQAILPLRGKIINIEKTDESKIYNNTEIQALISALGLGSKGDILNIEQLRYRRIIIMTDADVDGAHIRTLLLTFFYRYQRKLIEEGFVYIACPPLYKIEYNNVKKKKTQRYCYSEGELEYFLFENSGKLSVQRFKGLGEMMPEQLWKTTMDPDKRILKRVEISDGYRANKIFSVLMGEKVLARKKFIQIHANKMKMENIDY